MWNSYASRHYDASGQLIDDTVVLTGQMTTSGLANSPADMPNAPANDSATSPTPSDTPVSSPAASAAPATDSPAATPIDSAVPARYPSRIYQIHW